MAAMQSTPLMTDYFRKDVLAKRPYLRLEWCLAALSRPIRREIQAEDGRIRHWIFIPELDRYLRVVTLPDGVTLHNAFPDRRFKP
ncbi:MAG: putative integron protein cassette protein [bacterium]|nr:MAG: putative integron protein cassette protein [bacterium]KAF0148453.1 MAG: putative integron protein cassette protein [bacterium]KAF0167997.1 MAG: putative integron protein cassette protein [bacterium]TXT21258.1 MAG: putative integron protein cassette protein [bacterium]